jgi:hypothetical protein
MYFEMTIVCQRYPSWSLTAENQMIKHERWLQFANHVSLNDDLARPASFL